MVDQAVAFLTNAHESEVMVQELIEAICENHPATGRTLDEIGVRFSQWPKLHSVSPAGFLLLARAEEAVGGDGLSVETVTMPFKDIPGPLLLALGRMAARQQEPVGGLEVVGGMFCTTREEGEAMAALLGRCTEWWVGELGLMEEVGPEAWAGLAKAVGRGAIYQLVTVKELLARVGREQVRAVWGGTGLHWRIQGRGIHRVKRVVREGREEEGWKQIIHIMKLQKHYAIAKTR
jgi:hypothetical protein